MSASKILFFLCISFVAGVFLESVIKISQFILWIFLLLAISSIFFVVIARNEVTKQSREYRLPRRLRAPRNDEMLIAGFCLLFLVLGILRVQITEFNISNDKLSKLNGDNKIYALTGVINDEPDVRDTSQKLKVKIGGSLVLVTTKRYPEYNYLDKIKLTGKLETPSVTDDFNYKNYLLKDHIYSVINFPKIEPAGNENCSFYRCPTPIIYAGILWVKQRLVEAFQENFLPPHSLLLEGIIFGNNKNMTQELRDQLNASGLRFLTAISGVHVIILSAILINFLMFLKIGRKYSASFSIILIWLYIVLTGLTTSGIRAGIMGSIFILAGVLGRQNTSSRTIILAATLMLLQNPLLLIYDAGFQLSFMACLGIIYLKPVIDNFLPDIISVTITAQAFTLPIMIYNFSSVSLSAIISNILIVPIMPEILSFGFLFSIFASVSKFLGLIFYVPTWLLISYFIKVMEFFSQPWMVKTIPNVSWIWLAVSYLIIFSATYFLNKKYSQKFVA